MINFGGCFEGGVLSLHVLGLETTKQGNPPGGGGVRTINLSCVTSSIMMFLTTMCLHPALLVNTHVHTHTRAYTHIPTHTHTHAHTYICTRAHTHTQTYAHTHAYSHLHTHTRTHTHTHIHTYTHTHIQIRNE